MINYSVYMTIPTFSKDETPKAYARNQGKHPTPTGTLLNLQYFMEVSVCRKEGCDVCF